MAIIEIKRDPSQREVRQFAIFWLSGFCLLLAVWSIYRFGSWATAAVFLVCAATSAVLGLLRPDWMRVVFLAWMWAAFPLGWIIAHVLMLAIYFLVVTPIGLAMRAVGRDPLSRQLDRQASSYWIERQRTTEASRYFRQF
jgi:hypothetical protein